MALNEVIEKVKTVVATVAPTLGAALGGPLGGMAGAMVQKALGASNPDEVLQILETDPDALAKIKEAENEFKVRMRELDIDERRLYMEDTKDARLLARDTGTFFQAGLTVVFIVGYFAMIYLFFANGEDVEKIGEWGKGQIGILLGMLTGAIPQILAFWFGTSEGSRLKNNMIAGGQKK